MRDSTLLKLVAAAALSIGITQGASAAIVSVSGTNVTYRYDDSQFSGFSGWSVGIVGSDELRIDFNDFNASALNGLDIASGTFSFTATANPGYQFASMVLNETGGYTLVGGRTATAGAAAQFELWDNKTTNTTNYESKLFTTSTFSGSGFLTIGSWGINGSSASIAGWATTSVRLRVTNLLFASAGVNAFATISKSSIFLTPAVQATETNAVPLPASVWLLGTALLAFIGIRRRQA